MPRYVFKELTQLNDNVLTDVDIFLKKIIQQRLVSLVQIEKVQQHFISSSYLIIMNLQAWLEILEIHFLITLIKQNIQSLNSQAFSSTK